MEAQSMEVIPVGPSLHTHLDMEVVPARKVKLSDLMGILMAQMFLFF